MGTKERLRKIAKREAKSMGHDLGNFVQRGEEYVSWCMTCHSPVFIYPGNIKSEIIPEIRDKNPNNECTISGLKIKEAFPKRGKGSVHGPVMNYKCEMLQKDNTIGLSPEDLYTNVCENRGGFAPTVYLRDRKRYIQ